VHANFLPQIRLESVSFGAIHEASREMAMRRTALAGLALSIGGAIGIVTSELVGTAYAGRASERDYLIAISSGSSLEMAAARATVQAASWRHRPNLSCDSVVRLPGLDLGYLCKRSSR
jgi:hypothetical protein